ncbi:uncharacterized protein TrAFT101_006821 [Trichoderma asperellum]|uniref:uncharacterized protein n=1 Tax=Trichoderma asperellum TaxID=101201 RepID=UPI00331DA538|nr:hypothetical protein TrAFT101_006821 [Trichoderma asperellum]
MALCQRKGNLAVSGKKKGKMCPREDIKEDENEQRHIERCRPAEHDDAQAWNQSQKQQQKLWTDQLGIKLLGLAHMKQPSAWCMDAAARISPFRHGGNIVCVHKCQDWG